MNLSEMDTLSDSQADMLTDDNWTIEKLATATVKELMAYKGIGRVGAGKIITEATEILNEQGLDDAEQLATERYYQTAPTAKILTDWEEGGLPVEDVALSSARALALLKGIDEALAMRLISKAQDLVNQRGLYQSKSSVVSSGPIRQTNPAFDEKWLSGDVEPPAMSIRVQKNFEAAKREYKANK